MAQEAAVDDWSAGLALSIAAEVRRHRQAQGLSAQQLSDRCAEIGMPIQRSVLANLESGRRSTVNVAELLVLAAALQVAPAQLIFPVGQHERVEMLPRLEKSPYEAIKWLKGAEGPWGQMISSMSSPITAYDWHVRNVDLMHSEIARRDQYRRQYLAALTAKESGSERYREVKDEIAELSAALSERTEGLRGVPLAERPPKQPEIIAMQDRLSELRAEAKAHEQALAAEHYLKGSAPAAEGRVVAWGHKIARIRRRMEEAGWILPELPDDIAEYVINPQYPDPWQDEEDLGVLYESGSS